MPCYPEPFDSNDIHITKDEYDKADKIAYERFFQWYSDLMQHEKEPPHGMSWEEHCTYVWCFSQEDKDQHVKETCLRLLEEAMQELGFL